MRPTPRFWRVTALALFLSVLSVVLTAPWVLVGTIGLFVYLLASAAEFYGALGTVAEARITQQTHRDRVVVDQPIELTLAVLMPAETEADVTVTVRQPASVRFEDPVSVHLSAGETEGSTTGTFRSPVAGQLLFDRPEATVVSERGLFVDTISVGDAMSVTAEPRGPRRLHVGQGGNRLSGEYGEHGTGTQGEGIDPVELRRYVIGDDLSRIDWKATARLDETHIREYEVETAHRTALFVDRRPSMAVGPPGESKLAYLREVAIRFVESASEFGDAISYHTVEEEGYRTWTELTSNSEQYVTIRRRLERLEPRASTTVSEPGMTISGSDTAGSPDTASVSARKLANRLSDDQTAMARTLRPYFETTVSYVARFEDRPLFGTIRRYLKQAGGAQWLVIFTDDTNRGELHETVKLASKQDRNVLVFLTPSSLFDVDGVDGLETAYRTYRDFEEYRQSLDRFENVSAFEVAPGDKLEAILSAGRSRRRRPNDRRSQLDHRQDADDTSPEPRYRDAGTQHLGRTVRERTARSAETEDQS